MNFTPDDIIKRSYYKKQNDFLAYRSMPQWWNKTYSLGPAGNEIIAQTYKEDYLKNVKKKKAFAGGIRRQKWQEKNSAGSHGENR